MDNFNKVISFVLGLIVVVVLLVILTGRFNLREKFLPLAGDNKKITTTPTPKGATAKITPTVAMSAAAKAQAGTPDYHSYNGSNSSTGSTTGAAAGGQGSANTKTGQSVGKDGKNLTSIPKTGAPTALIPVMMSMLGVGIYLSKKK